MDLELTALNPDLGEYFGARSGVLVTKAPEGNTLPFKAGDVLVKIGDREPKSPGQALRILRSYEPGEKVGVELVRHQKPMSVTVTIPERKERMHLRTPVPPAKAPAAPLPPRAPTNA
jgi:S1-C subfamily serine protease